MALIPPLTEARIARAKARTLAGLWLQSALRAFWPLFSLAALSLAAWRFGALELLGPHAPAALWTIAGLLALALLWGVWRMRRTAPHAGAAEALVDARLPGRPLAGLADAQAIGRGDAASEALWKRHKARLAEAAASARAVAPDLALARFDPFGLRLMAATTLGLALFFGGGPVGSVAPAPDVQLVPAGPSWEGWAEPPRYAGQPGLYLSDVPEGALSLPQGTLFTFRLYDDALRLEQSIAPEGGEIALAQSGRVALRGPGGRVWDITMEPDAPPSAFLSEPATARRGVMQLPFSASDDFGIRGGEARISLDLPAVERRFGLAPMPDPRPELVLDLPMPFARDRREVEGLLREDLSQHPFARLPVVVQIFVEDEAGQQGRSLAIQMDLPGKRFFEPAARALAEQRRDLLWARANGPRVARLLRAIAWQSEGFFRKPAHGAALEAVISQLEAAMAEGLDDPARDEIAAALWALALELEEGSLANARERLARAQERLAEAMRNGASADEIAELMEELRAAKDDYMRLLAENAEPATDGTDQPDQGEESRNVTQQEIDRLMDEIQRLMEEGRMDEAQVLMEQLNALLENLRMQEGSAGDGPGTQGERDMDDLRDNLREQQELSDEAFRELQDRFNGRPGTPQQPGETEGAPSEQGEEAPSLAERQEALREQLGELQDRVDRLTGEEADAAQRALDEAGAAMRRAEDALRADDLAGAIDNQGQALEALREGMRSLQEALDAERSLGTEEAEDDGAQGEDGDGPRVPQRDPLGRNSGGGGQPGGDALPGEADREARARELLEELRQRLGERMRPEEERDYLERLLDQF